MKDGVRIINCARGGLVDEEALARRSKSGKVAGAGDRRVRDRAGDRATRCSASPNVVCTPHLGASTTEAQENVALQVAEQMADYLITGAVSNALNMPSITAEEAPRLTPFVALAEKLGSFAGQLTESGDQRRSASNMRATVADMNTRALTAAALAGVLQPHARRRQHGLGAGRRARARHPCRGGRAATQRGAYESYIRLTVVTDEQERSVAGTVFSDGKPRIIQIKGINMEAEFGPHMLYVTNQDKPGFIGRFGTLLGNRGINIATFHLGRNAAGGDAIALVEVDEPISDEILAAVRRLEGVGQAKLLSF